MINTAPTFGAAKSGGGASMGASIGPQPGAGNTMSKRVAMQRPPKRNPGMDMRGKHISQMGPGAGMSMSHRPGGGMGVAQSGVSSGGFLPGSGGVGVAQGMKMKAPRYSGPYGHVPTVGGPSPMMGGGGGIPGGGVRPDTGSSPLSVPEGMSPGQRFQGDGLLAADGMGGPVAQGAPPMFMPPPGGMTDMSGGNMGATAGMGEAGGASPMLAQYLGGQKNQDPRFRY